jgi:probable HAF family extracellular repeat protein
MGYATGPEQAWQYAFAWSATNGIQALTLGGNSTPRALSEAGHIVGNSSTSNGNSRGFRWKAGEGIMELPAPGGIGGGYSDAFAVNSMGQVVGFATFDVNSNVWRAALWLDPPPQPIIQIRRSIGIPSTIELHVHQLVTNIPFTLEMSADLAEWGSIGRHIPSATSHTVSNVLISTPGSAFYRIRIP